MAFHVHLKSSATSSQRSSNAAELRELLIGESGVMPKCADGMLKAAEFKAAYPRAIINARKYDSAAAIPDSELVSAYKVVKVSQQQLWAGELASRLGADRCCCPISVLPLDLRRDAPLQAQLPQGAELGFWSFFTILAEEHRQLLDLHKQPRALRRQQTAADAVRPSTSTGARQVTRAQAIKINASSPTLDAVVAAASSTDTSNVAAAASSFPRAEPAAATAASSVTRAKRLITADDL